MKKFVPIALLLCVLFSLSSFVPVKSSHTDVVKNIFYPTYPITGTTNGTPGAGQPIGTIDYEITGYNGYPLNIKFFIHGTATQIGSTYPFSTSGNPYYAASADMKAQTGIIYAQMIIDPSSTSYILNFESL